MRQARNRDRNWNSIAIPISIQTGRCARRVGHGPFIDAIRVGNVCTD